MEDPFNSIKDVLDIQQTVYNVIMGLSLVLSLLLAIGMGLSQLVSIKFRFFIHVSWWILTFFAIFGFMIALVLGLISYAFLDFCTWFDGMLNDQKKFEAIDGLDDATKDRLIVCLFGDGDLMENLGVKDAAKEFDNVISNAADAIESNKSSDNETQKMQDLFTT